MKSSVDQQLANLREWVQSESFMSRMRMWAGLTLAISLASASMLAQNANGEKGLSKEFSQSAIKALVSIHQAKENIANVVAKNLPGAYYDKNPASRAYLDVRTAELQASTNDDQQVATMLGAYFSKVQNWGLKYKSARESMDATHTTSENFLANDADWQAIESCEKGLNSVLIAGSYNDVASCH